MFDKKMMTVSVCGREMIFETGKIARQAAGSVMLRSGETILLATVCSAPSPAETDFLPLRVDYQEKFSAAGKTLGGFIKREGRPTEREILLSRLIDRPLRPLFPEGYHDEVQVLAYVLSYDGIHAPDPLAICACSAALMISDIPFSKPVAAVRIGLIDGQWVINPTVKEQQKSRLDLILAGTEEAILMIEGYCDFLTEEQVLEAIEEGHAAIKVICQALLDWQKLIGKQKNHKTIKSVNPELVSEVEKLTHAKLGEALRIKEKGARTEALQEIEESLLSHFVKDGEAPKFSKKEVLAVFKQIQAEIMRKRILTENVRIDGRALDQVRPIDIELSILPRAHGSVLFTRGETQALAVATLGGETMAQRSENLDGELANRFYLQYAFPPYSVGEVGRLGTPGRREIGHGKLAEKSLALVMPSQEQFPYVVRLESNITESNGSSSMASVCGGCLALMDAGVPIRRPVAGIAMGLILEGDRYAILSDILGVEDALGDMDFKLSGDAHGIAAFQLDIKIEGITPQIMKAALAQAKQGRTHILNKMLEVCAKPKPILSVHAPRIQTMQISQKKIGTLIGPGGKQIRAIIEETGAQINVDDSGLISISATNPDSMQKAKDMIHNLTAEIEEGKVYTGKIMGVKDFGAFVEIYGKQGLCHKSELSHSRVDNAMDVVKEGQTLEVMVLEITDRGQIRLSHKALLPPPPKRAPHPQPQEHQSGV